MSKDSTLLIVDDEPENLRLLQGILHARHRLVFASNGAEALRLAAEQKPDLILLDVLMPDMDGYAVCRSLKADPRVENTPIIFISSKSAILDEKKGFEAGAVDYIAKPVSAPLVRARVETHLALYNQSRLLEQKVRSRTEALDRIQRDAIFMLGEAGHFNDTDTGVHIWRMAAYSRALARAAGWTEESCELLELAAPMHDTGKIGIPDEILKKPGKLSSREWAVMRTHCAIGHDILSKSDAPVFKLAAEIAHAHHERWDGGGYPRRLKGENIPESARIVSISDVFDALTMRRPYKDAWPAARAVDHIRAGAGAQFDPRLVDIFETIVPGLLEIRDDWNSREALDEEILHSA